MYDICNNEVFTMETTYSYLHRVQYYETDGMRIVHHANYIHWMEEARIAYMEEAGYGYDRMEADGIAIPVLGIDCQYKAIKGSLDLYNITNNDYLQGGSFIVPIPQESFNLVFKLTYFF